MIGPNDKRAKVTRCVACAKRKTKCHGGFPCAYCIRVGQACTPPETKSQELDLKFTRFFDPVKNRTRNLLKLSSTVPPTVALDPDTKLPRHFFAVFLLANDFTSAQHSLIEPIARLYQTNSSLRQVVMAISALDSSRRSLTLSQQQKGTAVTTALTAYRKAVTSLQNEIESKSVLDNDASLWSTFLLGIFELMYDVTGEGWVKHILYGTSKILQLRGATAHMNGSGRSFFLTFRVFEICRALIYNDSTFLDQPDWRFLSKDLWNGHGASDWIPKEALLDLMVSCSALSMRGHALDEYALGPTSDELLSIAIEGLSLQSKLFSWSETAAIWSTSMSNNKPNSSFPQTHTSASLLAQIYYHASLIFLSGIFDYRSHLFQSISSPRLPVPEIQYHVTSILEISQLALNTTSIAGILLFFPLRVAGARAARIEEQVTILGMLREIERRNFVVAGAFVEDLERLWLDR